MRNALFFKQIEVGPMANFVYLIGDREKMEAVVVDPAWQTGAILTIAQKEGFQITGALITHGHYDHCNGIDELLSKINVPIYLNENEMESADLPGEPREIFWRFPRASTRKVSSGDKIPVGTIEITTLHTPGHSPGSQCFLVGNNLVSGDTLFIRGCGRCDLPGSSPKDLYESLTQKLMKLPGETLVFPGHNYADEPVSTIEKEKMQNPCFLCSSPESFSKMTGSQFI